MSHIIYNPHARRDLKEIWRYIARDHISNADAWYDNIIRSVENMIDYPEMGATYPGLGDGIRGKPIGNYLILYKAIKGGIKIYRIIHSARDLKKAWDA